MKTILITGSTDGIGKLAAVQLAQAGHEVLLHGRNAEKLATAIEEVKSQSQNKNVRGFVADFSDLKAVRKMAEQINEELPGIDVLINNAGVFKSANTATQSGLDLRIVVNYLAPYVLTNALLPLLQKRAAARIINLSSAAQAPISYLAFQGKQALSDQEAYAQSKLALTMWSFHLAKSVPGISVIAVNPGSLLNTKMAREAYGQHWSPADKGSGLLFDLAVSEAFAGVTGKYFDNDKGGARGDFGAAHPHAYLEVEIGRLVEVTEGIVEVGGVSPTMFGWFEGGA